MPPTVIAAWRVRQMWNICTGGNLDDIHAIKKFAGMGEHLRAALVAAQMVWRL